MKIFKKLALLNILCGMVAALAQTNPCTDACDKPVGCFKKRVNTHTLLVRDNAQICGDLSVKGQINNLELELLKNNGVPPTDEVYNSWQQHLYAQNILEVIKDFLVPRDTVIPGTEPYAGAPVYGYNEDQSLDLTGGPEMSYNPDFSGVDFRYHGQNQEALPLVNFDNIKSWYEHAISYYLQRGFPMPGPDVYPQYEGQFIFSDNLNSNGGVGGGSYVAVKFVFDDSGLPIAVDLAASASFTVVALQLYEANILDKKNGFFYPIRIPITTDIGEFSAHYDENIAYFDSIHRQITIHVSECNSPEELSRFYLQVPCCTCNLDIDLTENLVAFDGTFNLMRRNEQNQLVSSSFADSEYLIQASKTVHIASQVIDHGQSFDFEQDYVFSEPGGIFSGLAIPLMNGGGPQADIYAVNPETLNAFTAQADPLLIPQLVDNNNVLYQAGDDPVTTIIENLGISPYNGYFETSLWNITLLGLPLPVMLGKTTPEENPLVPAPDFVVSSSVRLDMVVGHEYLHNTQDLQGSIAFVPTEGMAQGIEQDPRLNHSIFSGFRPFLWARDYMPAVIRGNWPVMLPELDALPGTLGTYGSSIFWRYLATQFDHNYQTMRRVSDIISNESLNPLLVENGIPFELATFAYSGSIGKNPTGSTLALAQALKEIHNLNLKDVFTNYAISLAMLRNNESITAAYRHEYPYWLSSPSYPYYEDLSLLYPAYATWWQDYQDNNASPRILALTTSPAISDTPFTAFYTANGPRLSAPLAAQGEIADPSDACSTVVNDLTGKIGIVLRNGECGSSTIVANTEAAGNPIAATLIIAYGADPSNFGGNPAQTQVGAVISAEDGDALLAALEVNPTLTLILEPAPFVPLLDQDVIDRQVEDMTMLIYQIPQGVNTVTVDVTEGEWRLSMLQFNADGTPQGQFLIDGPHENNGGQTVFDVSQFTGDGYIRLVAAHVSMHDYGGLSNWCQDEPILTGKISILQS